ncbi:cellulase family glycosylhydrolase [Rheinheimera marina]|uniref:Cellulase family glycosylhydrolase n=1 Tax=Rheinheimera marina TaxID=1774958 RepID=A0ABV9JIU0_9GAMM
MRHLLLAAAVLLSLTPGLNQAAASQAFVRAQGTEIVDPNGQPLLLRGMGLGGWMLQEGYMLELGQLGPQHKIRAAFTGLIGEQKTAEFYQAWLTNFITKADIDAMADWGYNSVRLPLHFNLFTLPVEQEPVAGQNTWLDTGFALTDQLLAWAKANRIYLILDLHAAPGGQGNDLAISDRDPAKASLWDSQANQQKTIALWQKLASRYANEPWIAGYDLLNEPNWGFSGSDDKHGCRETSNAPLRQLLMQITAVIRQVDQQHLIFIEGNCWGNNYQGLLPVWDKNMALSFHKYWNNTDLASLDGALKLRQQHQVPIWLGESGENSNQWFSDTIATLESQQIGWAFWPLKKLRLNNPLHIQANAGYQQLVAYLQGKAAKPSADAAYQALMQLATQDVRFEYNKVQRDVVAAMLQQPQHPQASAFVPLKLSPQGLSWQAADYDLGGQLHGYFALTASNTSGKPANAQSWWNSGMVYRNDGIDLALDADQLPVVNALQQGEWLHYSLKAPAAGAFELWAEVKAPAGASLQASLNQQQQAAVKVQSEQWQWQQLARLQLLPGNNSLQLASPGAAVQLRQLKLQPL